MAEAQYMPRRDIDGLHAFEMFAQESVNNRRGKLFRMARNYVDSINSSCSVHLSSAIDLDKPNLHNILELFAHTIPAFGHISLIWIN